MTPDWVPHLATLHACGTVIGVALLIDLIDRMCCTGLWRRYPAFTFYLLIAVARVGQWAYGLTDGWYMLSESVAMLAKAIVILEGFIILWPRPRMPTLELLLALAGVLASITLLLPYEPNVVREFERWRQAAHVGMAVFCAAALGRLWIQPRSVSPYTLTYWRIWTFRLICMAVFGFVNYPAVTSDQWKWIGYYVLAWGYLWSWCSATALWTHWAKNATAR